MELRVAEFGVVMLAELGMQGCRVMGVGGRGGEVQAWDPLGLTKKHHSMARCMLNASSNQCLEP